ncbi:MAG: acetyl-CoA carboxylase biotin carboxylase subunit [Candidatus Bathyarchaeia archaeon]
MFNKILIANRGEIALRIIRACKELGIKSVAVFSEADKKALHVRYADEAYYIGSAQPSQSYLNIQKIVEIAQKSSSEAIHPGYGFLAQIPEFARRCETNKITFIGPSSQTLRLMGNKITARKTMREAKVPVIPGSTNAVKTEDEVEDLAMQIGYPILIKAVYGGGGKGLRIAKNEKEICQAMELAKLEAEASFGNTEIYVEKLLEKPRHIEFQVLADKHGNVIHLGERECSIQRRHQKLIEETPSPMMTEEKRTVMGQKAAEAAKATKYVGAGTIEFLVDESGAFYFLEMNTRLQVEHLVTEMVTGVDIVKEQIRIAAGEKLSYKQSDIVINGHALNCRINAEDPSKGFAPSPGTVTHFHLPGGPGIRVDTALFMGCNIPLFYDSLIAKIAAWGRTRQEAIFRMRNALQELFIEGVLTTASFLRKILMDEDYQRGHLHTCFVDERMNSFGFHAENTLEDVAVLSAVLASYLSNRQKGAAVIPPKEKKQISLWKASGRVGHFSGGNLRWIR